MSTSNNFGLTREKYSQWKITNQKRKLRKMVEYVIDTCVIQQIEINSGVALETRVFNCSQKISVNTISNEISLFILVNGSSFPIQTERLSISSGSIISDILPTLNGMYEFKLTLIASQKYIIHFRNRDEHGLFVIRGALIDIFEEQLNYDKNTPESSDNNSEDNSTDSSEYE